MSAPTLDRNPETTHAGTTAGRRRGRRQLMLVASALLVLAVAVGTSLAIATRPTTTQASAETGVAPSAAAADQNANADQGTAAQDNPAGTPTRSSGSDSTGTNASGLALPDGDHDAYITKVDRANNRIVADVVQVFHDDAAVKAAIADGKSRSDAQYLTTWVRNQNPRLRTLPLASGLVVKLAGGCEESSRDQLLTTLASNASQKGVYYYTLTLSGGKVQRIQERLAINAC
ncbi:MAG TPA: hypothetical protein VK713_13835 [Actinomycetes bacterium]|jgi:hypothetical protein|nr:hypothetical protein [Actinomycetes bacterium]